MFIVNHGVMSSTGIIVTCPACGCRYTIEDRKDWDIHKVRANIHPRKYIADYSVKCPECHYQRRFGYDYHLLKAPAEHASIFDRLDWKERYEVNLDEDNNEE